MPKKAILIHCPPYVKKFCESELAHDGVVHFFNRIILVSDDYKFFSRYYALKKRYPNSLLKVECLYAINVKYLAAMEFHLRFIFYTHLWTSVRVAQKFHYPAYRAIEDFLHQYKITPDELDPDSLYRQWQRLKNKRKQAKEAEKSHRKGRGEQINLHYD